MYFFWFLILGVGVFIMSNEILFLNFIYIKSYIGIIMQINFLVLIVKNLGVKIMICFQKVVYLVVVGWGYEFSFG